MDKVILTETQNGVTVQNGKTKFNYNGGGVQLFSEASPKIGWAEALLIAVNKIALAQQFQEKAEVELLIEIDGRKISFKAFN